MFVYACYNCGTVSSCYKKTENWGLASTISYFCVTFALKRDHFGRKSSATFLTWQFLIANTYCTIADIVPLDEFYPTMYHNLMWSSPVTCYGWHSPQWSACLMHQSCHLSWISQRVFILWRQTIAHIVPLDEFFPTVYHMLLCSEALMHSETSKWWLTLMYRDMSLERDPSHPCYWYIALGLEFSEASSVWYHQITN